MTTAPLVLRPARCADLDELSARVASMGFALHRTQLGGGRSACGIRVALSSPFACIAESTGVPFHNRAATPPDRITFGLRMGGRGVPRYAGGLQGPDDIRVAPPAREVDIVHRDAQVGAHIAFDVDVFARVREHARVPCGETDLDRAGLIRAPQTSTRLRGAIRALYRDAEASTQDGEAWAERLALILLDALRRPRTDLPGRAARHVPTLRHIRRAQDYVEAHLARPIRLAELCASAGVGSRTLQRAFLEHLDLTPLAYVQVRRLRRARRLLRARDADGRTAAEVAQACGLRHAGRFSAAYFSLFGEYPRDTLAAR